MGSGTSRIGSDPRPGRVNRPRSRTRTRLTSLLLCGSSSSDMRNHEKEHYVDVRASSLKKTRAEEESTSRSRLTERSSSNTDAGTSSEASSKCLSVSNGLMGTETNTEEIYLKNSNELGQPNPIDVETDRSRSMLSQENEVPASNNSSLDLEGFNLMRDARISSNGVNYPMSIPSDNDSTHLELSSNPRISSDVISNGSSERLVESLNRDISSSSNHSSNRDDVLLQNRNLADSIGGLSSDGAVVSNQNVQRRHSRSEIWDIVFDNINDESPRPDNLCPFGVHSIGSCSCESFLTGEESSIHLSISRIVMLAEALFEVLDEMNPRAASFSLPLASVAAPESVVDSFPLRQHKKAETAESSGDIQQCHICLSEYEDGDKIRLLPCHHEYHMACVDKWLKEFHGVCPLCRGEVANGVSVNEASISMNSPPS